MGIFGKLFDKKICAICGAEIGLLGNRKLEDGNCCKKCAAKLSPWFNERRHSTVAEIKSQIEYREANRSEVEKFRVSRTIGENVKVLVDEAAGKFMVTRARDLAEENPDVLRLDQVTGCDLQIREHRDEVYWETKNEEGETVRKSYMPPRYRYSYDFRMVIHVNHPYFDEMDFPVSDRYVSVETYTGGSTLFSSSRVHVGTGGSSRGSATPPSLDQRRSDVDYARYEQIGMEIKEALAHGPTPTQPQPAAAAEQAVETVTCPWCDASAVPDENGCCPHCGGQLKE